MSGVVELLRSRRVPQVAVLALILVATGFVLINLLVDVLYCYLDPRVRTEAGA